MAKTVVLVRHGKAVARERWRGDDSARPLTEGGVRSLRAKLPTLAMLLDRDCREGVEVWTSSAMRAVQTAELVSEALAASQPVEHACLSEQDADAFLRDLAQCGASCVIAVGHNPFMDDIAARLSGVRLPFFTGAAAALFVEEETPFSERPSARLAWFVQGPRAGRFSNVVALERIVAHASDVVEARLVAFFEKPDDSETMHKLRVSIRTMRSLLAFIEPWQKRSQGGRMQKDLRTVVRWTSRLRELDVLVRQAADLESPCEELVAAIASARDSERRRVAKKLAGKKAVRLLGRVRVQARRLAWRSTVADEGVSRKAIRTRFDTLVVALERDMDGLDLRDAEATHDARKAAKRVRYAAENFAAFLDERAVDVARRMVKAQDGLGAVCDARVNLAIIEELSADGLSEEGRQALAVLRRDNEAVLARAFTEQGIS